MTLIILMILSLFLRSDVTGYLTNCSFCPRHIEKTFLQVPLSLRDLGDLGSYFQIKGENEKISQYGSPSDDTKKAIHGSIPKINLQKAFPGTFGYKDTKFTFITYTFLPL